MKYIITFLICLSLLACDSTPETPLSSESFQNTSKDPEYGYVVEKPIKLGGFMTGTKYENTHFEYFKSLIGPNGETVTVKRMGSCCAFEGGLLDRYQITYEGLSKPLLIYVNLYQYEQPKAPSGLVLL